MQARNAGFGLPCLDVLHHHHGCIHQHADGNGQAAERHQVGRQPPLLHQHEGGQGRQGQDQGHHQRRAQVAQKQQQQHQHQHNRFAQGLGDRRDGAFDQVAPVVKRHDLYARGQGGFQFGDLGLDIAHQFLRVGAAQAQHQSLHGLALAVLGNAAITRQRAQLHRGHITHAHRFAVALDHRNGAHIVQAADAAIAAHQQGFFATGQAACAVVTVVGAEGVLQLLQRHPARCQRRHIGYHLKRLHHAAQGVHIGHARNAAQARADHGIEQLAPLGQAGIAIDREHEHFAQRRGDGCQSTRQTCGQVAHHARQAFAHLLAGPVDIGAVGEVERDVGDGVFALRAQHDLVGDAQQFLLDGGHDACLDLGGSHAGGLEDDLDLGGRYVGKRVDWQVAQGHDTGGQQRQRQDAHQQALRE